MCVCMYICMCICMYVYMYVYMYVCMYVCMYGSTYQAAQLHISEDPNIKMQQSRLQCLLQPTTVFQLRQFFVI